MMNENIEFLGIFYFMKKIKFIYLFNGHGTIIIREEVKWIIESCEQRFFKLKIL